MHERNQSRLFAFVLCLVECCYYFGDLFHLYTIYISLSGVMGRTRILFPVALKIALATAGAMPTNAISPSPFEPIGLVYGSFLLTK